MDQALAELPRLRYELRSGMETSSTAPIGLPDRRIALALCEAQAAGRFLLARRSGGTVEQAQTVDEILEVARQRGWNHVFKTLKAHGLLEEQTLGHVVARWAPRERGAEPLTSGPRAALRIAPSLAPSRSA